MNTLRWQERFSNLLSAEQKLEQALQASEKNPDDEWIQIALIKIFEMTFELAWKTLKDFLNHEGFNLSFPREILKQGFASELLENGQAWIDMLDDRNLMAHPYDAVRAQRAIHKIREHYQPCIKQLCHTLQQKMI